MASILMVAEKPSIAEAIAKGLSPGGRYETHRATTPVHTFSATYLGQRAYFKVKYFKMDCFNLYFSLHFLSFPFISFHSLS